MLIMEQTIVTAEGKLLPSKHKIEMTETISKLGREYAVRLTFNGTEFVKRMASRTLPTAFTTARRSALGPSPTRTFLWAISASNRLNLTEMLRVSPSS